MRPVFTKRFDTRKIKQDSTISKQIRVNGTDKNQVETYGIHMLFDNPNSAYVESFPAIVVVVDSDGNFWMVGGIHRIEGMAEASEDNPTELRYIDAYVIAASVDQVIVESLRRELNLRNGLSMPQEELLAQSAHAVSLGMTQKHAAQVYGVGEQTLGLWCRAAKTRLTLAEEGMSGTHIGRLGRVELGNLHKIKRLPIRRQVAEAIAMRHEDLTFAEKEKLVTECHNAPSDEAVTQIIDKLVKRVTIRVGPYTKSTPKLWLRRLPATLDDLGKIMGKPGSWTDKKVNTLTTLNRKELRKDLRSAIADMALLVTKIDV